MEMRQDIIYSLGVADSLWLSVQHKSKMVTVVEEWCLLK